MRCKKNWPKVDWDTKIFVNQKIDLNLDQLPEMEKLEATKLLHEILNDWQLFERNITEVLHRVVPRCNYTEEKHTTQNIKEKMLFIMSDASGGDKFGLLGAVAYLRIEYTDKSFTWQNLASMCKIAPANMTIVVRELRALLLSIKLADKCQKALIFDPRNIHHYVDNTVIIDMLRKYKIKEVAHNRISANTCALILKTLDLERLHFVFSEANSADYLTRPKSTHELFQTDSIWFRPMKVLINQGYPSLKG